MELSSLTAVSPVDGRYGDKVSALRAYLQRIRFAEIPRSGGSTLAAKTGRPRSDQGKFLLCCRRKRFP